jgi:hypothetical protein
MCKGVGVKVITLTLLYHGMREKDEVQEAREIEVEVEVVRSRFGVLLLGEGRIGRV